MPTESTFLFAGLLFLAAALGYVFARFGDADEEEEAEQSARTNFLRGFRYLLNEESDRAVDVFTGANDLSDEAMETQLALGTLFRRRGEIDRAIRLHQNLVERPVEQRGATRGCFVCARRRTTSVPGCSIGRRRSFVRLRDSRVHGVDALKTAPADLRGHQRLGQGSGPVCRAEPDRCRAASVRRSWRTTTANLPSRRGAQKVPDLARQMLSQAEAMEPGKVRTALIRADLDADSGPCRGFHRRIEAARHGRDPACSARSSRACMVLRDESDGPGARCAAPWGRSGATPDGPPRNRPGCDPGFPESRDPLAVQYLAVFVARQPVLSALAGAGGARVGVPGRRRDVSGPCCTGC